MGFLGWVILSAFFAICEIIIPNLITIWLAFSAILVSFISLFFKNIIIEFSLFIIFSYILLILTKPFLKVINRKDNLIKNKVKIIKIIDKTSDIKTYEVKFKGVIWTSISYDVFNVNEIGVIKGFDGNKIILEKIYYNKNIL